MKKAEGEYLLEASWEVCNKVGGIYTVVKSKAALLNTAYKNYFLIGPYFKEKAEVDLEEKQPPEELQQAFNELKPLGINCHYGHWQIKGEPQTILIDFQNLVAHKGEIKKNLWESFKVDSYASQWDFEEPVIWAWAVGILIEKLHSKFKSDKIITHFHEWLAGAGLLYLKEHNVPVATIFTTHATMLGRTLCGSGADLYSILDKINPRDEAYNHGIQDKFLMEKISANTADIFTTVSEITGLEAEKILGRKPEVLVLNGLDIKKFPTIEETSVMHINSRGKIREFLKYHTFPYYSMDLDHNLIFFMVGRYEFKNKGVDIYIKALGDLNNRLKKEKSQRTVTAFIWIPCGNRGIKTEILENKNYYRHIRNFISWNSKKILQQIEMDILSNKDLTKENIFTKDFLYTLKKDLRQFKREGLPPLVTHQIDEPNDSIMKEFWAQGLLNRKEDNVKVVFYPVYLDGNDEMINLPYYDAMVGCHLGVFPSYYEPWGYTPLEAAALGVPAVTTDLAGFGLFIDKKLKDKESGIFVLKRQNKNDAEISKSLGDYFYNYCHLSHVDRIKVKQHAKILSELADWSALIDNYIEAHNQALKRRLKIEVKVQD